MSIPIISTRAKDTWTWDERKTLDRAAKLLNQHGDRMQIKCGNTVCPEPIIHLAFDDSEPGGAVLRCGCTDRLFVRAH